MVVHRCLLLSTASDVLNELQRGRRLTYGKEKACCITEYRIFDRNREKLPSSNILFSGTVYALNYSSDCYCLLSSQNTVTGNTTPLRKKEKSQFQRQQGSWGIVLRENSFILIHQSRPSLMFQQYPPFT